MNNSKPKRDIPAISTEILQNLFESGNSVLSEQFIRWKLWKKWEDFVGKTISAISEPVGYRNGTLYVWVKNSSWMQQMIFMLEPMKASINKKLGIEYVKGIHLTLDRKSVPHSPEESAALKNSVASLMKGSEK